MARPKKSRVADAELVTNYGQRTRMRPCPPTGVTLYILPKRFTRCGILRATVHLSFAFRNKNQNGKQGKKNRVSLGAKGTTMQSRKSNNPDDPSDVEVNQPTLAAKHKKPYEKPAFRYEKVFVTTAVSCRKVSPVACSGATKSS
jgi:hypothetical protein